MLDYDARQKKFCCSSDYLDRAEFTSTAVYCVRTNCKTTRLLFLRRFRDLWCA